MNPHALKTFSVLEQIASPDDLKGMSESDLQKLAGELREFMVRSVSKSGGHLASSLGAVELAIALHTVFDTPEDRLVWDVGHQAYAHKILTGRREGMGTIRQKGGLSGFPSRDESPYDTFGVGHSSTSISAALGMSLAAREKGLERECVAVIGDGAMTAGEAFEAMNHAGDVKADMIVVLNDNTMSISENVGALAKYFGKLISGKFYSAIRERSKKLFQRMPDRLLDFARRAEEHVKGMVVPGTLFEEMGFTYFGPVDGHDLPTLLRAFRNLKSLSGPRLLHVVTQKGKGYAPAETNPIAYHGVSPFDPETGMISATQGEPTFTEVFGQWICWAAEQDSSLAAITPAMREGSGLVGFSQRFPERFFDVAIAEQHAVTFAAGLATEGVKPIVAIYSTFLQRAYDQLVHDVALQNLPVIFAVDRAGIVGQDGSTHNGYFDIGLMRAIPNMVIMAPSRADEAWWMLNTALRYEGPVAIRYPRDKAGKLNLDDDQVKASVLSVGKANVVRQGQTVAFLVFGPFVSLAMELAEQMHATVVDMRFIKPLDSELLNQLANTHSKWVTIEDGMLAGGAGSAVLEYAMLNRLSVEVSCFGLPDLFLEHGKRDEILTLAGLDLAGIKKALGGS
jgi:1-deoxy-D-xylulose-5-phosphate synthase